MQKFVFNIGNIKYVYKLLRIDTENEQGPLNAILEVLGNEDKNNSDKNSSLVTELEKILKPENWQKKRKDFKVRGYG